MPIDGINERAGSVLLFSPRSHHSNGSNGRNVPNREQDVRVSDRTHEFLRIRRLVDDQPDVRLDRVNRLAKAIDEGTYNVSGERIAEAIIEKHLIDLEG